jgi:hypothetical protein
MAKSNKDAGNPKPVHHPGARKGEDIKKMEGKEPGRHDGGTTGAKRPAGKSTARDSTRINPKSVETKTPGSPQLPTP